VIVQTPSLFKIFEGWEGYNRSLISALEPLPNENLAYRPGEGFRSVGEIAAHISEGRVSWFSHMEVESAKALQSEIERKGLTVEAIAKDKSAILDWLERSWSMVETTLENWTADDLWHTYAMPYQGKMYAVPRQWMVWRVLCHDIHHGGQLCELLYAQGIEPFELGANGGHITAPPEA
jgi:uncharacterized damage-inducible protein DinB